MDADALLDGLTPTQTAAVASEATPLCILAGAGSGKTRVLTRRIAYRVAVGSALADHVLAVTFTRKAAGELRRRLVGCGVQTPVAAGTIHGVAFAQLRQWHADHHQRPPAVLDRKARLLGPLLPTADARMLTRIEAEISWAQTRCLDPDGYARAASGAGRRPPVAVSSLAEVFARYEVDKRRRGLVDLDDLVTRCAQRLETDAEFADAQRWRWRHLFVDEYQDLNPSHDRLVTAWLGGRLDLCVVGDPYQSIYGWNGADPSLLTSFTDRYPTAAVLQLRANFRSSPEILVVAGAVLADAGAGPDCTDDADTGPMAAAIDMDPVNDPGPVPTLWAYADEEDEANGIARRLRDCHRPGTSWSHFAVLARTNSQLRVVAGALAAAGIPHEQRGDRSHLASGAGGLLASYPPATPARTVAAELRVEREGGVVDSDGAGDGGTAAVTGTVGVALEEYLDLDPKGSVGAFITWLESTANYDDRADGDVVALCTFHRAKGLEWPVVFVAGLEDGLVPLGARNTRVQLAEERRLLYVALTRPQRELHCSWARRRMLGGRTMERLPSPFLGPLQLALVTLGAARASTEPRPHLQLLSSTTCPPASEMMAASSQTLLDDLRRWRATAARAAGVAPTAVLRDETLVAVATTRPSSPDALVALPGFGPVAARRWGPILLDAVARHAG